MPTVDLVLEGGGVKGIGLVGAVSVLEHNDFTFARIAGTSAGAIVAALLAAGVPSKELVEEMRKIDYKQLEDCGRLEHFGAIGQSLSIVLDHGAFRGDYLHTWLAGLLAHHGVSTWGDLRRPGVPDSAPIEDRYRLVVVVSDISRGKMLRLPWDYEELCGLDPDTQSVADAVRASASIPFVFEPVHLACGGGHDDHTITLLDGGLLSNFPVEIFDTPDEEKASPTIGIKLSAGPQQTRWHSVETGLQLALAILGTMAYAHDQRYIDEPAVQRRTIFVDTSGVRATHFTIDAETREQLLANGIAAAKEFLAKRTIDLTEVVPGQRPVGEASTLELQRVRCS